MTLLMTLLPVNKLEPKREVKIRVSVSSNPAPGRVLLNLLHVILGYINTEEFSSYT